VADAKKNTRSKVPRTGTMDRFWLILTGWRSDSEETVSLTGSEGEWKPLGKRGHRTYSLSRTVSSLSDMVVGPETIWNGRNAP
jgi:hypothetical protein